MLTAEPELPMGVFPKSSHVREAFPESTLRVKFSYKSAQPTLRQPREVGTIIMSASYR